MLRQVNGIYVTECICYPRSGHHLLTNILHEYFDVSFVYCEQYKEGHKRIDKDENTNYQKNHDFDLDTEIKDDRQYLIQVRNPLHSLPSRWAMEVRGANITDTEENYRLYMKAWSHYWAGFMAKWVLSPVDNRLVVRYEDLMLNPVEVVVNVIQFLTHEANVNENDVRAAIQKFPPEQRTTKPIHYCQFA